MPRTTNVFQEHYFCCVVEDWYSVFDLILAFPMLDMFWVLFGRTRTPDDDLCMLLVLL